MNFSSKKNVDYLKWTLRAKKNVDYITKVSLWELTRARARHTEFRRAKIEILIQEEFRTRTFAIVRRMKN